MRGISWLDVVTLVSVLGCGLIAGVFFAFSTFVMKALGAIPPPQGIAAMQSINIVVINPVFLTPFVGTAATCAVLIVASVLRWNDPRALYWLLGGLFYVVGCFLVTMMFNVPRNDALAALTPSSADAVQYWTSYLSSWTTWNHVRTAAALVAALLLIIAFRYRG